MERKMNARNFGLRSSNMGRALITAYQMKSNGDNTKNNCKSALTDFAKHLKDSGINDLRKVEKNHVLDYARTLNERFEGDIISASTAQNYLSKVNIAMENARLDRSCRVEAVKQVGLPTRTGIAHENHSISEEKHQEAIQNISPRLAAQLTLQRELGLRFKESCLINAKQTLEKAKTAGVIQIDSGTKGGRPREFPVTSKEQIHALEKAAEIQANHYSLIPTELTWAQYQNQCYREVQNTSINFHGERHHYANNRYEKIAGVQSPIVAQIEHGRAHHQYIANQKNITLSEAKKLDHETRMQIAQELGHGRVSITNNYLG